MGPFIKIAIGYLASELVTKEGRKRLQQNAQDAKAAAIFIKDNAAPIVEIAKIKAADAGAKIATQTGSLMKAFKTKAAKAGKGIANTAQDAATVAQSVTSKVFRKN